MPFRDLEMLDDATFDATGVQVTDGRVVLLGRVVEHGTSAGTARLPVTLTVPDAIDVTADLAGGTGDLVLDRVEVTPTTVTLVGVIPGRVVVTTAAQSRAVLEVGTTPIAVRRRGRWRPWAEGTPVVLDHRAVLKRLRNTTCPACEHPWAEHAMDADASPQQCSECRYEREHGQMAPGTAVCSAPVPPALVAPRSAAVPTPASDRGPVDARVTVRAAGGESRPAMSSLREAGAALAFGLVSPDEVSTLAAELVAAGHDGDALVALASLYSGAAPADALDLGRAALVEAGIRPLDLTSDEVPLLALRNACRRFLRGEWALRTFSSWVHDRIGHDGPEAARPLVEVDDRLDELEGGSAAVGSPFHRAVERLAVEFLDLTDATADPSGS